MSDQQDFGNFLATVEERDVDLLLMEEFHVSNPFVLWFCKELNLTLVSFDGAWHSVTDSDGETDLLLRVFSSDRRIGILIENKICAREQDKQDERYHIRGARLQQEGRFDIFITCICASQAYIDGLRPDSLYQYRISYEKIAEWFKAQNEPRHHWRYRVMQEAIAQARRGYTLIPNLTISEFHLGYWEYSRRRHPHLLMRKPTMKGSKSNWIIMRALNFPKFAQIHHKLDQRVVELGFNRRTVSELLAIKTDWPNDIICVQKGKVATLSVNVPAVDMAKGIAANETALEAVFLAIERLIPFGNLFDGHPPA